MAETHRITSTDPRLPLELLKDLRLDGWVKLRPEEFSNLPPFPGPLYHVNALPCTHRLGQRFGLVKIAKPGTRQEPPELDYSEIKVVTCERVQILQACSLIDPDLYPRLIGIPRDLHVLACRMVARYRETRDWKYYDSLNRPVMLSKFSG